MHRAFGMLSPMSNVAPPNKPQLPFTSKSCYIIIVSRMSLVVDVPWISQKMLGETDTQKTQVFYVFDWNGTGTMINLIQVGASLQPITL